MKINKRAFVTVAILLVHGLVAWSQEKLSLQQALELALKNNYSISISSNQAAIAKNDYTRGNAGMLPSVALSASAINSNLLTNQTYSSGEVINQKSLPGTTLTAGPQLNWTLFDGMKMFATYDQLKVLQDMGELNARMMIENTIARIIGAYFDIARQKQLYFALQQVITIYEERLSIAQTKSNIGSGSDAEMLQAKVDLNEQKSAMLRQKALIENAKTTLNHLLSRDSYSEFDISDSIVITYQPKFEELKTSVVKQNRSLLFAEQNVKVTNYALKQTASQRYPLLGLNAGYSYTNATNPAIGELLNQQGGPYIGFSMNWTLFNGLNVQRQVKDAKINSLNSQLQYSEVRNEVESNLVIAYTNFQNALEVLKLEEENIPLAEKNVTINMARFRLGHISSLQLKDAQQSYLDAVSRLVSARYDAKVSETELMRLNGVLVK